MPLLRHSWKPRWQECDDAHVFSLFSAMFSIVLVHFADLHGLLFLLSPLLRCYIPLRLLCSLLPYRVPSSFVVFSWFFAHVLLSVGCLCLRRTEAICCRGWCVTLCCIPVLHGFVVFLVHGLILSCVFLSLVVFQGLLFGDSAS